jgi:hypothetical protein
MASGKTTNSGKAREQHANGAENLGEELEGAASEATQTVQEAAGGLTQNFREQITGQVTAQQERAVDTLETVALLLQQAGEHARKEDQAAIAKYADQASDQVERVANSIRDKEMDQLLSDGKQFAQQQPGLQVGGALLAGFLGARFLRSSAKAQQSSEEQGGGDSDNSGTDGQSTDGHSDAWDTTATGAYGDTGAAAADSGDLDTAPSTGAMTGAAKSDPLEGMILEEEAAVLEELEQEELLRQEEEGIGGTTTDDACDDGRDPETR